MRHDGGSVGVTNAAERVVDFFPASNRVLIQERLEHLLAKRGRQEILMILLGILSFVLIGVLNWAFGDDNPVWALGIVGMFAAVIGNTVLKENWQAQVAALADVQPPFIAEIEDYRLVDANRTSLSLVLHTEDGPKRQLLETGTVSGVQARFIRKGGKLAVKLLPSPLKSDVDWEKTQEFFGDEALEPAAPKLLECPKCAAALRPSRGSRQVTCSYCGAVSAF